MFTIYLRKLTNSLSLVIALCCAHNAELIPWIFKDFKFYIAVEQLYVSTRSFFAVWIFHFYTQHEIWIRPRALFYQHLFLHRPRHEQILYINHLIEKLMHMWQLKSPPAEAWELMIAFWWAMIRTISIDEMLKNCCFCCGTSGCYCCYCCHAALQRGARHLLRARLQMRGLHLNGRKGKKYITIKI